MVKNYLTVALRSLRRDRAYALVNVAGLAVGIACCLLIGLYVLDELRFDRFHANADRTFRVVEVRETPDLGDQRVAATVGPVSTTLVEGVPGVTAATRLTSLWRMTVERGEQRAYVGDYLIAEPSFFDVFSFELVAGDPATALSAPLSIVLTESAVGQYFGAEDPVGQSVEVEGLGDVTVTGVLRNPPANSHLDFSMLLSASTLAGAADWWDSYVTDWTPNSRSFVTYVTLDDPRSASAVEARMAEMLARNQAVGESETRALELQPLTAIHFGSGAIEDTFNREKRSITTLYLFSTIALFVLLIACINYMNLATARSLRRTREVGVRKAVGAHRGQLVGQFLSESVLLAGSAVAAAAGLVALALPAFNEIAGKALTLAPVAGGSLLAALVGLAIVVGVGAGSYPALYLSGFRPARALRGMRAEQRGAGLRRGLVVIQFALSIGILVATLTVMRQMDYIQTKPLGFDAGHLVVIDINGGNARQQFRAMKAELAALPAVRSVSSTSRVPGDWKEIAEIEAVPENAAAAPRTLAFFGADEDFLATFAVALAAGRNFSAAHPADSSAVLLNEAAVLALGLTDPVGQRLTVPAVTLGGDAAADLTLNVIGVVEDFHFRSLHEPVRPLVIGAWNNPIQAIDYFTARVSPEALPTTVAALRAIGEAFDPDHPFEYNFLDQRLADFYVTEARTARLFGIAAGLALFIACLGLLGLAAFVAEQRTKEIGVRKVLGASVGSIVVLLSKDFARLVLVGAAIAVPLAYLGMRQWLDGFAYRVELSPGVFLLAGGLALLVALATVSVRAVRAALADPVRSLRYE